MDKQELLPRTCVGRSVPVIIGDDELPAVIEVEGYSRMKPESVRGGSRRSSIAAANAIKTKASPDGEAFFG